MVRHTNILIEFSELEYSLSVFFKSYYSQYLSNRSKISLSKIIFVRKTGRLLMFPLNVLLSPFDIALLA